MDPQPPIGVRTAPDASSATLRRTEVKRGPDLTLRAGDGFPIPPGTPHHARDLGPGTGRMLSTYLAEIGAPLVTLLS